MAVALKCHAMPREYHLTASAHNQDSADLKDSIPDSEVNPSQATSLVQPSTFVDRA